MSESQDQNIIYIMTNPSFPDWIKIGRCSDLAKRIKSLSQNSAVPLPFECFYACRVLNGPDIESKIHTIFSDQRVSHRREFFKTDPEKVVKVLELVAIEKIDVNDQNFAHDLMFELALQELQSQNYFNFIEAGVPLGAEIYLTRDESVRAKVLDQHKVTYEGKAWDFTELTKHIVKSKLNSPHQKISTPRYWSYEGEMLVSLKHRLSKERMLDEDGQC